MMINPLVMTKQPQVRQQEVLIVTGKVVSGKAEAGATVYLVDAKGNTIGQSKADADGNYKITLHVAITDGNRVILYAKDKAGNSSQSTILTGSKETRSLQMLQMHK